jgi:hexose kinase, 1-phosphofructokinase family
MIGTVTLNPCVDRTCRLAGFTYGGMNRILQDRRDISGKGINVSLALTQNGVETATFGFLYRGGKEAFLSGLEKMGIDYIGVETEGQLRENIKLWDISTGVTTEVNQSGAYVPTEAWKELKNQFKEFVSGLELVILSGSVPKGIPVTAYRELGEIANEAGIPFILDAEGDLLFEGLKAHPLLIKPNEFEFVSTFKPASDSREDIEAKARELIRQGVAKFIIITLGKKGAYLFSEKASLYAPAIEMDVKSTQGAGDSVVAGSAIAFHEGGDERRMLSYGVAMAHGTISLDGTLIAGRSEFEAFLKKTKVEVI